MKLLKFERLAARSSDVLFVALILLCGVLALGAIGSGLERRDILLGSGGARKVDVVKIRKQISDGELSDRKALFYRKLIE